MPYLHVLQGLITCNSETFSLASTEKARKYVIFNIIILGVLFGLSNFFGALQTTPDLPLSGKFLFITPLIFSMAGIFTMAGGLIGLCFIYWAAARAFGGPGNFGLVFDLTGLALVAFWLIAPSLNFLMRYETTAFLNYLLIFLLALGGWWSFHLLRNSLITGQGIESGKASLAVICMWIFSISSVYVFTP